MFATGWRFNMAGSADYASVTSAALDSLDPWSLAVWFRPRSFTPPRTICGKGRFSVGSRRVGFSLSADGGITVQLDRSVTDLTYTSVANVVTAGRACVLVITFNSSGSANDLVRAYVAPAGGGARPVRVSFSSVTDGSGTYASDAGEAMVWGASGELNAGGKADLYVGILANVEWSAGEVAALMASPRSQPRGQLSRWEFGNGGAKAWDVSGNGRHATMTGGVPLSLSWAETRWPRTRIATAVAAIRRRLTLLGVA